MSSILNQPVSPDIHLPWIDISTVKEFSGVLFAILRRYEEAIVLEDPETSWADKQKPSVNMPLRSAFVQQAQVTSSERDTIEQKVINWLSVEEESDKLRSRYKKLTERQRDGLIRDRIESQIAKIRLDKAQEMQSTLFGQDTPLIWFANEEKTIEKLRKVLSELS